MNLIAILAKICPVPLKYDIYIGSDNGSRRLDGRYLDKILDWASHVFPDGYTVLRSEGYFDKSREDSFVVSAISEDELELSGEIRALKKRLRQDAILVTKYVVEAEMV